ncbi:MAG: ABC transporter permease subunit [Clostridia bacterium]|nr:ABC transporter permease subunit [Clostridia bacterium]
MDTPIKRNAAEKSHRGSFRRKLAKQRSLCIAILPALVIVIIFSYFPMYGIIAAFQNFKITKGYAGSEWVGLKNFTDIFRNRDFVRVFGYTMQISVTRYILGLAIPVAFALMLNELMNKPFKRIVQTMSYLPHFFSWVIVAGFVYRFLDPDGALNGLLKSLFNVKRPVQFFGNAGYFYPILIISEIWKSTGFSAIIYLAALSGIDPTLYEAAGIDGASKMRKIIHITLPGIMPTFITIVILNAGSLATGGFDSVFNLQNRLIRSDTNVLETYIYQMGLANMKYSFGVAAGLFQGLLASFFLLSTNFLSQRVLGKGIFKYD